MPTPEELKLALDAVQNLEGLRRDIRQNAQGYIDQLAGGGSVAKITVIALQDTDQYLRRFGWQNRLVISMPLLTKLTNGLLGVGVTAAVMDASYTEMLNAVNAFRAAAPGDLSGATTMLLASIAPHDTVW